MKKKFDFEAGQKRLAELEKLLEKQKQLVSESRGKVETRLKIICGAYFLSDKKRLDGLVGDKRFQDFLSAKDKSFVQYALRSLWGDTAEGEAAADGQDGGDKAPARLDGGGSESGDAGEAGQAVRRYLDIPRRHKELGKSLGARWDRDAVRWYAPDGVDAGAIQGAVDEAIAAEDGKLG